MDRNEIILAVVCAVLVVFSLTVAIVVPKRNPDFPGRKLGAFFLVSVVLVAGMLPQAVVLPVTDSVVKGYGIAVTPNRLVGRVESVRRTIALAVAPLGPLAAGLLLDAVSARTTVAVILLGSLALAVWATLNPAIRRAPSLDELR